MSAFAPFSPRVPFTNRDDTLSPDALRWLQEIYERSGAALGTVNVEVSGDSTMATLNTGELNVAYTDVAQQQQQASDARLVADIVTQPLQVDNIAETITQPLQYSDGLNFEMVVQQLAQGDYIDIPQTTTALAPAYKKGRLYFDTTLNKLRIGGASAYETITSV